MTPPDSHRTITATEAQRYLGIPSGSIRAWASTGQLFAVSIGGDGQCWYLLSEVLELVENKKRRRPHKRPSRASLEDSRC